MSSYKTAGLLSAALFMTVFSSIGTAQTIEEVTVTARKRVESYQDVPVTVDVFGEKEIQSAGISRPQDFIALTPNMTMVQTQNQGTSFITVRGISQARNSEPSVAVLIDGVLMANPSQFNQELYDIQHIEVLKGPQGALYGRNAIGGAIIINTKEPTDKLEGKVMVGYDSGPGYKVRGSLSGPVPNSDTLKFAGAFSYFNTDGYIENTYLHKKADPFRDISGRFKLLWEPNDNFKADARVYISQVKTHALYFNITENVNDTSLPVRVNNPGTDNRNMLGGSLKMDYKTQMGTLTTVTAYDHLDELLTGDQFDFLPNKESVLYKFFGLDQAQHQYLDVDAISQEIRFTSPQEERFRWILGGYLIATDRFISTGNVFDCSETGPIPGLDCAQGTRNVKRTPLPIFAPQYTFLSDTQHNFAWALFGEFSYDLTDKMEGSFALRYDSDHRENTTDTPQVFLDTFVNPFVAPGGPLAVSGQVRTKTWRDLQPKVTLRYKPNEDLTLYMDYSRGFRSGGFNQTGVGSAGIAGINDLFDEETANTLEAGAKAIFLNGRVNASIAGYMTKAKGSYYFVFDPNTSTQNLGNLGEVVYQGLEFEVNAALAEGLDVRVAAGYTNSDIKQSSRATSDIGNQAPLVSEYTLNIDGQYRHPLAMWEGVDGFIRMDFSMIGPTYWYPDNFTKRSPVHLLDLRAGVEAEDNWSLTFWSKNLNNEKYNAEWSPGPMYFPNPGYSNNFVFKAPPRRWGVDFVKYF